MQSFVPDDSIVKLIWGKADTILFIFGGAAAEFALNKAVDWLYFTGKLPADPVGRLFSTVSYARKIVFSSREDALKAIDTISAIHAGVEKSRGYAIPSWAYRDVLFMLIDYSIRAFELLDRTMTEDEKGEVFNVFFQVGERMNLQGLPKTYNEWLSMREQHLLNDLVKSDYTVDLLLQYKKHLGVIRYWILWQGQILVVPPYVKSLLKMPSYSMIAPLVTLYRFLRFVKAEGWVKAIILPAKYRKDILQLDRV